MPPATASSSPSSPPLYSDLDACRQFLRNTLLCGGAGRYRPSAVTSADVAQALLSLRDMSSILYSFRQSQRAFYTNMYRLSTAAARTVEAAVEGARGRQLLRHPTAVATATDMERLVNHLNRRRELQMELEEV
ncbi:hypothetical protein VPNG_10177 [Cytospora leucostoma]|uniref:Uncharacterized protein n=1 Tax=Cytospora leucostoma TaxID=1230097 RepID=A0A423VFE8_9PEZI|nr:hypothetical protein VPNG_10177 [Cytospora leucostoma]